MGRQIILNQDLSGQTIDVSTLPDGHARESYLGQVNLQNAKIIGDIRGSDILRCQGEGLDLSLALTYNCQWTQTTFDDSTLFSDDPGAAQYEITYELIRRYIVNRLPSRLRRQFRDALAAHQVHDYAAFCELVSGLVASDREEVRKLYQAMPPRMRERLRQVFVTCDGSPPRQLVTVGWPDGVQVVVDRDNLPALPRPHDRYELKQWISQQAGPITDDSLPGLNGHFDFVHEIVPDLRISALANENDWLELDRQQF